MTAPYRVERLAKQSRGKFDCGVAVLNTYLQKQARQEQRRRITVCYLLIEQATGEVAGFYTLAAGSVLLADVPDETARRLPRYPAVPVVRIGRLAVDLRHKGKGLGGVLLVDAIKRSAASDIGAYAVLVDAKSDSAAAFYEHHGFTRFESHPDVLWLPITDGLKRLN